MRNTQQRFLKGVNKRIPIDRQEADRLFTLENARLFQRDNTGYVVRIEGYIEYLSPEAIETPLDMIVVGGETILTDIEEEVEPLTTKRGKIKSVKSLEDFKKGYRIVFEEEIVVREENNLTNPEELIAALDLGEIIRLNLIKLQKYQDQATVQEYFRVSKGKKLAFIEEIKIKESYRIPNRITLTFTESIDVVDEPLIWLED